MQIKHLLILAVLSALACAGQAGGLIPGAPDRIAQVFDDRGRLLSQTLYRNGRKVGRHVAYWPGGGKRVETLYNGDLIEGDFRTWHANGQLAEVKRYVQGHEAGMQQAWTDRGELFLNFEVRNGRHFGLVNSKPCMQVQGAM